MIIKKQTFRKATRAKKRMASAIDKVKEGRRKKRGGKRQKEAKSERKEGREEGRKREEEEKAVDTCCGAL